MSVSALPAEWDLRTVGSLGQVRGGKRLPKGRTLTDQPTPHPYVRVTDMRPGGVDLSGIKYVPVDVAPMIRNYKIFRDDLFVSVAGTLGIVGRIPESINGANLTENADRITTINCDVDYLMYSLMGDPIQSEIESIRTVGAQPKLALGRIRVFEIAIPRSRVEQGRIAAALRDIDALIRSVEQMIAKKQAIKLGMMQQLLTAQTRLPGFMCEWDEWRLDEISEKIQDGTHFSPELGGTDFKYITSRNIGNGRLKLDIFETISENEHKKIYRRCDTQFGDLLLTKDGANTGNVAINTFEEEISLLSSVAFIRADHRLAQERYLLQYFQSDTGRRQIADAMSGNAITRLTLQKIRKFRIPVPPVKEQSAIAKVLGDVDGEIDALRVRLAKAKDLKQGMMQELLTGRTRLSAEESVA